MTASVQKQTISYTDPSWPAKPKNTWWRRLFSRPLVDQRLTNEVQTISRLSEASKRDWAKIGGKFSTTYFDVKIKGQEANSKVTTFKVLSLTSRGPIGDKLVRAILFSPSGNTESNDSITKAWSPATREELDKAPISVLKAFQNKVQIDSLVALEKRPSGDSDVMPKMVFEENLKNGESVSRVAKEILSGPELRHTCFIIGRTEELVRPFFLQLIEEGKIQKQSDDGATSPLGKRRDAILGSRRVFSNSEEEKVQDSQDPALYDRKFGSLAPLYM